MYKVELFFPIEFTEEISKRYSGKQKSDFEYLSPILQFNGYNDVEAMSELNKKNILEGNFVCGDNIFDKCSINHLFYPYGVSFKYQYDFETADDVCNFIKCIEDDYVCTKVTGEMERNSDYILIYDKPMIVIETESECKSCELSEIIARNLCYEFSKTKQTKLNTCYVSNDIIVVQNYTDESVIKQFVEVFAAVLALKYLSGSVRLNSKMLVNGDYTLKEKYIKNNKIHKECTIFEEIISDDFFRNESQKKLYKSMIGKWNYWAKLRQIRNAKENSDYTLNSYTDGKAEAIQNIVFITGIISIIFNFMAFLPFQGTEVFKFSSPVTSYEKIRFCLTSIGMFLIILYVIYKIYNRTENIKFMYKKFLLHLKRKKILDIILTIIITIVLLFVSVFILTTILINICNGCIQLR